MALPYYVTPLMGALAWSLIGSPSGGFLNQVWRALGGEGHLIDVTTPYGIAWVMALFEGSVAFVMIGAVMKSMDPALEEASQVLGAGRLRTDAHASRCPSSCPACSARPSSSSRRCWARSRPRSCWGCPAASTS